MTDPLFTEPNNILFRVHLFDLYDHSDRMTYTTWAMDKSEAEYLAISNVPRRYIVDHVQQIWLRKEN